MEYAELGLIEQDNGIIRYYGEMEKSSVLTLRIDAETKKQLDALAKTTHRRRSLVAAEALRNYLDVSAWQVREIEKAVEAADRGEFATEEEIRRVTTKWSSLAR